MGRNNISEHFFSQQKSTRTSASAKTTFPVWYLGSYWLCGGAQWAITVIHVGNAIMRPQRWISSNWLANKHWNGWPTIVRKITTRWDIWGQIELDRNMRGGFGHIITAFFVVFFEVAVIGRREDGSGTLGGAWRQLAGVLALPVSPQIHFPLEPFLTQAASKRLVPGVLSHVSDQVAALRERLGTHDALVRLLSWKGQIHDIENFVSRQFLEQKTRIDHTCVNIGVLLHVRLLVEPFSTKWARVGAGVWMDEQVGRQGAASLEGLSTLGTLEEAFLPGVWRWSRATARLTPRSSFRTKLGGGEGGWRAAGETSHFNQHLRIWDFYIYSLQFDI